MILNQLALDNHGKYHKVNLQYPSYSPDKPMVEIEGTPRQWYLSQLFDGFEDWYNRPTTRRVKIYLDFGQNWYVTNIDLIIIEAVKVVLKGELK